MKSNENTHNNKIFIIHDPKYIKEFRQSLEVAGKHTQTIMANVEKQHFYQSIKY